MPRLFTGLEVPSELAMELSMLRGGLFGARWIDEENYHVTLRFFGDIDHRMARDLFHELWQVRRAPVTLALEGLSIFGGDKPRSIIMRIRSNQALAELQAEHERIARRVGLPPETRKFTPHITLARLRGVSQMAVADYLGARSYVPTRSFTAEQFVLFSSRDSVGGGPYIEEATYPLRRRGEPMGLAAGATG
jgi:2'-5' RNA ligase